MSSHITVVDPTNKDYRTITKVTLNKIGAGYRSSNALNNDFELIEEGFEQTLSRTQLEDNQMDVPLDMNSNPILNLPDPVDPLDVVRLKDVQDIAVEFVTEEIKELASESGAEAGAIAGTESGSVAGAEAGAITGALEAANKANKDASDITDPANWRQELELGDSSTKNVGTTANTVAAGDDPRLVEVGMKLGLVRTLADMQNRPLADGEVYVRRRSTTPDDAAGIFNPRSGNQTANVATDPLQGVYVPASSDPSGASGAFKRVFNGGVWLEWFGAGRGNPAQDQAAWDAATKFCRETNTKLILLESKVYYQTDTIILPKGVKLKGTGKYDRWGLTDTGTIIRTSGSGTARRWTDITGSDPVDDTPQIVAGGNAVTLEDVTLITEGSTPWSMGFLIPGVRQCGHQNLQAFGHTDGCVYLDATWSSSNTTLTSLHPLVQSDNGPLEYTGINQYLRGAGTTGFGIKIQGTTRANTVTPWVWSPGGASDAKFAYGRVGSDATGAGGAISIDGQMPTTASTYIQGFLFDSIDLRISTSQYQFKADRANRVTLTNCYGEVSSTGAGEFAVTSRTQASLDGIIIFGDKLNSGSITVDGVPVTGSGVAVYAWEKTRCVSRYRSDGRIFVPNITASVSNLNLNLKSFATSGQIMFSHDNGSAVIDYATINSTVFRPITDLGLNLGSTNTRFNTSYVQTRRWAVSGVVADFCGSGTPEGSVSAGVGSTYRRTDGGAGTTFYVKETGTGSSGWVAK